MTTPAASAHWAMERINEIDAARNQWDETIVITAMRRHLVGLAVPVPDWYCVAGSPTAARTMLAQSGGALHRQYLEQTRAQFRNEREALGESALTALTDQIHAVFDHPSCEALVAATGGWEQQHPRPELLSACSEVAVAVGARAANMSPELQWVWDQVLIAFEHGLGWYSFVGDGLILLPRPAMTLPAERLHAIDGPAVVWPDGSESYFLDGVPVESDLHRRLVSRTITAEDALALADPDQQLLAIAAAPPDDILRLLHAVHLDTGVKGTRLYRIDGLIAPGHLCYCITMTDPSSGREYLEWVDPRIGENCDAELCQAHLFGIDLREWLSLRCEG